MTIFGGFHECTGDALSLCSTNSRAGKRITFLIGSEADAPFYRANDDELSQNGAWEGWAKMDRGY